MDNRVISQLLRGLKITTNYITALILFLVFTMPIITIAKDGLQNAMTAFSFLIFLFLFYIAYVDMRVMAFKEKRPQYNINPPPYKGVLYGIIGMIPLVLFQSILLTLKLPEDLQVFKRKLYQGFAGPLYWLSRLLGDAPVHYIISFAVLIVIAGLGYYAGFKEFYLVSFIREKLGINKKKAHNKK
ncbi:MAG: hypothetical protein GX227_07505 [Clostridiaceae bacterium]|nr:hypothetical protein [Clostridiaceae bacterium]